MQKKLGDKNRLKWLMRKRKRETKIWTTNWLKTKFSVIDSNVENKGRQILLTLNFRHYVILIEQLIKT